MERLKDILCHKSNKKMPSVKLKRWRRLGFRRKCDDSYNVNILKVHTVDDNDLPWHNRKVYHTLECTLLKLSVVKRSAKKKPIPTPRKNIPPGSVRMPVEHRIDTSGKRDIFHDLLRAQAPFWYSWLGSQLEAEVQQDQARESVLLSFGNDLSNSKACLRCKDPFPVLFARKKRCGICTFVVCRHCCRWDSRANLWRCHACARRRVLQLHSAAWLKDVPHHPNVEPILDSGIKRESDSENDSGYAPSVSPRGTNAPPPSLEHSGIYSEGGGPPEFFAGDEETTAAVRMHIERLIEAALGEEIDRVTLSKLAQHPQYDGLFHRYHRTLTDAINNLSIILEDAIQNRYDPSSTSPSPTDAHAALLHLIEEIQDSAQDLPPFKMSSQSKENQSEDEEGFDDNFSLGLECSGYADILSVAILNKIVCLGQPLLVHKSSEHMIVKENNRPSNTFVSRLEIGIQPIVTEDDLEESLPDTYKIEEEIKEVTTSYNDDDEMVSSLPKSNKVPFPELGVDLVDEDEIHHELQDSQRKGSDPSILVASSEQWEDNWLFRKKRMAAGNRISAAEPVPMLVPNPADEIRAQIGDRHADELSDLSDSPSDVEEHETDPEEEVKEPVPIINNTTVTKQEDSLEIEPEFAQQDSEYTEAYTSTMTRCKEPVVENIMPTELILNKSTPVPAPRIMTPPKWAENKPVVIVQVDHYQTKPNEPPSVEETIESDIPELLSAKTITERKQQWVAAETIVPVTEIPIVKQRINRSALARQRTTSLEFPEFETEEVAPATNIKTIDCGVKRAEQGRYSRDYYIHQQASTPKLPSSTTNSLPIIQDRVVVTKAKSLEAVNLRRQENHSSKKTAVNGHSIDRSVSPISPPPQFQTNSSSVPSSSRSSVCSLDKEDISLPSVKQLAKYFTEPAPKETTTIQAQPPTARKSPRDETVAEEVFHCKKKAVNNFASEVTLPEESAKVVGKMGDGNMQHVETKHKPSKLTPVKVIRRRKLTPVPSAVTPPPGFSLTFNLEDLPENETIPTSEEYSKPGNISKAVTDVEHEPEDKAEETKQIIVETLEQSIITNIPETPEPDTPITDPSSFKPETEKTTTLPSSIIENEIVTIGDTVYLVNIDSKGDVQFKEIQNPEAVPDNTEVTRFLKRKEILRSSRLPSAGDDSGIEEGGAVSRSSSLEKNDSIDFVTQWERHSMPEIVEFEEVENLSPITRVHSLTARSVPRQFREELKQGFPRPSNRNIKLSENNKQQEQPARENSPEHLGIPSRVSVLPPKRDTDIQGYTSDDSTTSGSGSIPQRHNHQSPPKRKMKSATIAARAAFWDKCVQKANENDTVPLPEDFPQMEEYNC